MSEEKLVPKLRFSGFDDDWEIKKLDELSKIQRGASPRPISSKKWYDFENKNVGWVRIGDVTASSKYLTETEDYFSEEGIKKSRFLPKGSLIMSICATIGKPIITDIDTCIHDGFVGFSELTINKEFLYYYLNILEPKFYSLSQTGSQANLNSDLVRISKIGVPSVKEQEKIVNFLSMIDKKIGLLEKKYNSYVNFKKYLMQQIFTQKLRFDKTSEWETFTLNDLGKTYNGLSGLSKDNFEKGNSKYITYKSIFDNNILKSDFTENVELNNKSQNEVKKGDLFFTGSSETPEEVGMVSVLNSTVEDCYLNSFCFGFRLNNNYDINPLFLAYYLRSPIMRNKIMILAQGSTRFNLSKKEILKLKVEIPPISEQQHVIDLFQNVDNKINEISMQTDNFNEFKKGLLQQMFV